MGILPGEKLAAISSKAQAHWARLSGTQVVAEIPLGEELKFWSADAEHLRQINELFLAAGARAIIREAPPLGAQSAGWTRLPRTDYCIDLLR